MWTNVLHSTAQNNSDNEEEEDFAETWLHGNSSPLRHFKLARVKPY